MSRTTATTTATISSDHTSLQPSRCLAMSPECLDNRALPREAAFSVTFYPTADGDDRWYELGAEPPFERFLGAVPALKKASIPVRGYDKGSPGSCRLSEPPPEPEALGAWHDGHAADRDVGCARLLPIIVIAFGDGADEAQPRVRAGARERHVLPEEPVVGMHGRDARCLGPRSIVTAGRAYS